MPPPYLSVVAAARNDDHGGNLLGRMQTFVNAFLAQCREHRLPAELILVEWNPPADRPPLREALRWPADLGPCRVRVIQVPPGIHRRYWHAASLPLYQMIAKNAGIRRARGEFVLVTNIDILLSSELFRFLAARCLRRAHMYRLDRHDVMTDVPVEAPVEERLEYCRRHLIRIHCREGTFSVSPEGRRLLAEKDIAAPDSGITLGRGWYPVQSHPVEGPYRWLGREAEFSVPPRASQAVLFFDLEPGPGAGGRPVVLEVLDSSGKLSANTTVERRCIFQFPVPAGSEHFRFRVVGGGQPIPGSPHILNLRVYRCSWSPLRLASEPAKPAPRPPEGPDIDDPASGIRLGAGWYAPESHRGRAFRWVAEEAEIVVSPARGRARKLVTIVQAGPAAGFRRSTLEACDESGRVVASAVVRWLQPVRLALPWRPGRTQVFTLRLRSSGPPVTVPDPRALRFRLFRLRWSGVRRARLVPSPPNLPRPSDGWLWGWGWSPDGSVANGAELVLRRPHNGIAGVRLELEPAGGSTGAAWIEFRDISGRPVARGLLDGRQIVRVFLPLDPRRTKVLTINVEGAPAGPEPALRLFRAEWQEGPAEIVRPGSGITLGAGWSGLSGESGQPFRVIEQSAEVQVRRAGTRANLLALAVEPVARPAVLCVFDTEGPPLTEALVDRPQLVHVPLPAETRPAQILRFALKPPPGADWAAPLRVQSCDWDSGQPAPYGAFHFEAEDPPDRARDILPPQAGVTLGEGWRPVERTGGELFRWAATSAEVLVSAGAEGRPLALEIEPGPAAGYGPIRLLLLDDAGNTIYRYLVYGRRYVELLFPAAEACRRYRLHAEALGGQPAAASDPLWFRAFRPSATRVEPPAPWLPESHAASVVSPEDLHLNACGDFTLMAREHWFALRGYPEFDLFSMHLDSILCYAAHHAGFREEVLADPLRIYHIEHAIGSGWTPEGHAQLYQRIAEKGIPALDSREVFHMGTVMRRLQRPLIFNLENWGLADETLPETEIPAC